MNRAEASAPRGATGRADLLRALAVTDRDHLALDIDASSWFGYVRRAEEAPRMVEIGPVGAPRTTAAPAPTTARKLPLRLPFLHLIVQFGIDTGFGVYADLTVTTRHGRATQRLRWMEPGIDGLAGRRAGTL